MSHSGFGVWGFDSLVSGFGSRVSCFVSCFVSRVACFVCDLVVPHSHEEVAHVRVPDPALERRAVPLKRDPSRDKLRLR